jgi:hypothetical protein
MIEAVLTDVRVLPGGFASQEADDLAPEAAKRVLAELAARAMGNPTEDPLCHLQGLIALDEQSFPIERFGHARTVSIQSRR